MIQFSAFHVELSLPVAQALAAFASKDTTRPHLGIGLVDGQLCSTDGHVLLVFDARPLDGLSTAECRRIRGELDRRVWSRSHVETAVKVARAKKASSVTLLFGDLLPVTQQFPPIMQVIPDYGMEAAEPIGFNPAYLGQLSLVAKACGRRDGGAALVSAKGACDPMKFRVNGPDLDATAVVMPMRV